MLIKVNENIRLDKEIARFTISGDPGCDGYNVEAIMVLESIVGRPADLHLLLGDLVPTGRERWFAQIADVVDRNASAPVHCLAGNHDLPDYSAHLGKRDYFIKAPNALVILIDNARRYFTEESIAFLRETLANEAADNIFLAFHIPPPNPFIPNSVSQEEWNKIRDLLLPHRDRVRAVLAGHVHSAFEFDLDGFRVIVTGGAGARLDKVENTFFPENTYHVLEAVYENGAWRMVAEAIDLGGQKNVYAGLPGADRLLEGLAHTFSEECQAYRRYLLFADQARAEGYLGVAKLFQAAAESEFYHSRNMMLAAGGVGKTLDNVRESINREHEEWTQAYPEKSREAAAFPSRRAKNAYDCAAVAERGHHGMMEKAEAALASGSDIPVKRYFTCNRCGYTHEGDRPPTLCPACGTDQFRFTEV